jgi:hypothetical protein
MRKKLTRSGSRRLYSATRGVNGLNYYRPMRGGVRL